jgi:hypothetical protein
MSGVDMNTPTLYGLCDKDGMALYHVESDGKGTIHEALAPNGKRYPLPPPVAEYSIVPADFRIRTEESRDGLLHSVSRRVTADAATTYEPSAPAYAELWRLLRRALHLRHSELVPSAIQYSGVGA